MNIFIIGAGFTKAVLPDAPLNRDLLAVLVAQAPNTAAQKLRDRYSTDDIEVALTRLDMERHYSASERLDDLRRETGSELAHFFSKYVASEAILRQAPWTRQFCEQVLGNGDVVVSLNYDCVIEGLLDCCKRWSPNGGYGEVLDNPLCATDGYEMSPITVLKIHGSANFIVTPKLGRPGAESVGYEFNEHYFPVSALNKHYGYGLGEGRKYVIAPSYVKNPAVEITYLMLDALRASAQARRFVLIGCGIRPEDTYLTVLMTNFLHQSSWQNRKIIIVDPAAAEIGVRIHKYWNVNIDRQLAAVQGRLEESVNRLERELR